MVWVLSILHGNQEWLRKAKLAFLLSIYTVMPRLHYGYPRVCSRQLLRQFSSKVSKLNGAKSLCFQCFPAIMLKEHHPPPRPQPSMGDFRGEVRKGILLVFLTSELLLSAVFWG